MSPKYKAHWQAELTEEAERWYEALKTEDAIKFTAAINRLERVGPVLGRPRVDSIKGSRHHNMKELRVGNLRALFVFGPDQRPVVLVGGDKTGAWKRWYKSNIPIADNLYDEYLRDTGREGSCPQSRRSRGRTSAGRGR